MQGLNHTALVKVPIYLDYAATTPLDPLVKEALIKLPLVLGNANSMHAFGDLSRKIVLDATNELAALIKVKADPASFIWTSGATEANNLAILGAARFYKHSGRHIICASIEHDSVLAPFKELFREGFEVSYLKPNSEGFITPEALAATLRKDTLLVSIAGVNGEVGTIQPLDKLVQVAHSVGALFHSDLTMALGRMPLDLTKCSVDLATFSAHKIYGPIGVGALYRSLTPRRVHLTKIMFGGLQQDNLRPGSLPVPLIYGLGVACSVLNQRALSDIKHLRALETPLIERLSPIKGVSFNGPKNALDRAPGIINLTIAGGDLNFGLLSLIPELAAAYSAACHWDCQSSEIPVSNALLDLGVPSKLLKRSVRLSFGRFTTSEELTLATQRLAELAIKLNGS